MMINPSFCPFIFEYLFICGEYWALSTYLALCVDFQNPPWKMSYYPQQTIFIIHHPPENMNIALLWYSADKFEKCYSPTLSRMHLILAIEQKQLEQMWGSVNIIYQCFVRLGRMSFHYLRQWESVWKREFYFLHSVFFILNIFSTSAWRWCLRWMEPNLYRLIIKIN